MKRRSEKWQEVMGKIFDICGTRALLEEDEIDAALKAKRKAMDELIALCVERRHEKCAVYLANAKPDMFTAMENRLKGKATSLVERVMRTVNMRVNVGKWTASGALNAMNVRLAHYYNGWSPSGQATEEVVVTRL